MNDANTTQVLDLEQLHTSIAPAPGHLQPITLNMKRPELRELRPAESRRVATLERQAPRTIELAREAGVAIEYLGIAPLFSEPRLYSGIDTDWVFKPADATEGAFVPNAERRALQRLRNADLDFPLIYVAHEIPKSDANPASPGTYFTGLDAARASELVGPVPAPLAAVELSARLSNVSAQILVGLGRALPIAGAIVAAPFVLVGAAVAGLATLDPIVFGVVPAISATPGDSGAWYVLARWEW